MFVSLRRCIYWGLACASYWIDTFVLNRGKYLRYCAASPPPLRGKPTLARDVARAISGAVAGEAYAKSSQDLNSRQRAISGAVAGESTQKSTYQVPITPYLPHYIICHLPLVFLSPTSPLPFYSPFPPSNLVCLCVGLFVAMA